MVVVFRLPQYGFILSMAPRRGLLGLQTHRWTKGELTSELVDLNKRRSRSKG